jgi:hypothetical protein
MAIAAGLVQSWDVGVAGAEVAGFAVAVMWVVSWLAVGG